MKFRLPILLVSTVFFLLSCDKDTFETKPSIKVKSLSSTQVPNGGLFTMTLEYTDKEGDVNDSIFLEMEVLNQSAVGEQWQFSPLKYKIPAFPSSRKGEIAVTFAVNRQPDSYQAPLQVFLSPYIFENDTANFKIWVKDEAQNYSDTITTEQVVFIR
ncbi:MAG: hypothetical protein ACO1NW_09660 [Chitinophagaceae bacterium]